MSTEQDSKSETTLVESKEIPGARYLDPRKTDLELFYALLPGISAGLSGKNGDTRSSNAMALVQVRELIGQCVFLGVCRPTMTALDGAPLALMPNGAPLAAGGQSVAQPGPQGSMVAQYPNMPGQGMAVAGTVQQHPNYSPPAQAQGGYTSRAPVPGQTSNIQPVAMFPTGAQPPQL